MNDYSQLLKNSSLKHISIAWVILVVTLSITLWNWTHIKKENYQRIKTTIFDYRVTSIKNAILNRMFVYQEVSKGAAGLFTFSTSIKRSEWHDYVQNLQLDRNYPGIQGIGFLKRILPDEKAHHIAEIRAEGGFFQDYTVRPEGKREEYFPIVYIEPIDKRNQQAIGYDGFSEPTRRFAMQQSRDTGETILSDRIRLIQEVDKNIQTGCILYAPVYHKDMLPNTVAERRTTLMGYVYIAFRMNDLMRGILGKQQTEIDFEIYDGNDIHHDFNPNRLMYDEVPSHEASNYPSRFQTIEQLEIAGHIWTIRFVSLPQFDIATKTHSSDIILWGGIVISLLLFAVTHSLESRRLLVIQREHHSRLGQEIAERQRIKSALHHSEEKYQRIVEAAQEGIWVIDAQADTIYVNAKMAQMLGYTETEMLGKSLFNFMDDIAQQEALQYFERRSHGMSEIHDFRFQRKDGSNLWAIVSTVATLDEMGRFTSSFAMVTDITERKKIEFALSRAKEQAEIANRAKSVFLANMSHELRTPLNSILGYAQILSQNYTLTKDQRQSIHIIARSGEYLLTLINDVLDLAKIEAGKIELTPTIIELEEFLQGITRLFNVRAEQKNLEFCCESLTSLPFAIYADEKKLRQVIINLLGNAFKFTQQGHITLKVAYKEEMLHFQVEDTGCGIAPADLDKIFDPFQQVGHEECKAQGTGLGLSIAKNLVEMMKGTLQVTSVLGQGSTFAVALKLPEAPVVLKPAHLSPLPRIIGYQGEHRTLLIIDDNWTNRSVLTKMLTRLGFTTLEAEGGCAGFNKVCEFPPFDAILVDLVMPRLNGFALIAQLKTLPQSQKTVLIAISASAFEEDRQHSLELGCHAFIAKPINFDLLLECLRVHLNLTWLYEQEAIPSLSVPTSEATTVALTSSQVEELLELTRQGDIMEICNFVEQLEQSDEKIAAFARYLHELATQFKVGEIRKVVQKLSKIVE